MKSKLRIPPNIWEQIKSEKDFVLFCTQIKRQKQIIFLGNSFEKGALNKQAIKHAKKNSFSLCISSTTGNSSIAELEDISLLEINLENLSVPVATYILPGEKKALIDQIFVPGNDYQIFQDDQKIYLPSFMSRQGQIFGDKTLSILQGISVGIVGASGTGCFTIDMLTRLGVRELNIFDDDKVEECNLNRIINSTRADIGRYKVDVAKEAVERLGLGTVINAYPINILSKKAVELLSTCDFLIGCVDTAEGRHLLNLISTYYLIPYLDVGVAIEADRAGNVDQVCGSVHYIFPSGSSLVSRKIVTPEQLRAEGLKRSDPDAFKELLAEGYISGVNVASPAVISLNGQFSSMLVNELLARIHPYRHDCNSKYNGVSISLSQGHTYNMVEEDSPCQFMLSRVGLGDTSPLLDRSDLS